MTIFNEPELEAHQILTRIFFNLKKHGIRTRPDFSKLQDYGDEARSYDLRAVATKAETAEVFIDAISNVALPLLSKVTVAATYTSTALLSSAVDM
jgi:hypothetical protein